MNLFSHFAVSRSKRRNTSSDSTQSRSSNGLSPERGVSSTDYQDHGSQTADIHSIAPPSRSSTTSSTSSSASSNDGGNGITGFDNSLSASPQYTPTLLSLSSSSTGHASVLAVSPEQRITAAFPQPASPSFITTSAVSTSPVSSPLLSPAVAVRPAPVQRNDSIVQLNRHFRTIPDTQTLESMGGATVGCLGYGTPRRLMADEDYGPPPPYDTSTPASRKKAERRLPLRMRS